MGGGCVSCTSVLQPSCGAYHRPATSFKRRQRWQPPQSRPGSLHTKTPWAYKVRIYTPVMLWTMTVVAMTPWTRDYHLTMTSVWVSCCEERHGAVRWRFASVLSPIVSYCISKVTTNKQSVEEWIIAKVEGVMISIVGPSSNVTPPPN